MAGFGSSNCTCYTKGDNNRVFVLLLLLLLLLFVCLFVCLFVFWWGGLFFVCLFFKASAVM